MRIRLFSHYISGTMMALIGIEVLILMLAVYVGVAVRLPGGEFGGITAPGPMFPRASVFALTMLAAMTAMGLYRDDMKESARETLVRVFASFVVGLTAVSAVFYLVPSLYMGRGVLSVSFVFALAGSLALRYFFFNWVAPRMFKWRVLVLGTGSRAASAGEAIRAHQGGTRVELVGYLPLAATQHHVDPGEVLASDETVISAVRRHQVDEIVIALRDRRGGALPVEDLLDCKLAGVRVTDLSSFLERETGQVHLESLNASWLIFGEGFRQGTLRDAVKQFFDFTMSAILLVIAAPVMLVTALLILIEDGRPLFYRQERVGQFGRTFSITKFRSMGTDAEKDGKPRWATANDDRTTRVGRVIRRTRIDELPQLFNVLRGDMSFVGPRPERPFFVEQLVEKIPYYSARHTVKPGVTGWAQVRYPYGASLDDAIDKLQYDLYYVKNHTLFLDIMIIVETVYVVLWGKGAR